MRQRPQIQKCCLNQTQAATQSYGSEDRDQALVKVIRFATRSELKKEYSRAFELFWGDWTSETPDHELRDVMAAETVNPA